MSKMKPLQLLCQNCNMQYEKIKDFKAHVRNSGHKQEVTRLFHTAVHKGPVYFPMFVFLDYLRNPDWVDPLIGFDMVTLFITPEKSGDFYLCHVCEEQINTGDVVLHLCSVQHYLRYLACTNPELLRFAWLNDSFSYLQSSAMKEYTTNGSGNLRVFELPKMILRKCIELPYHQVMSVFSETDKLMERIQAGLPQRKSIQEYIADPARSHPLLGLNLLLEYSCPKNERYCGYLCILCKEKLSASQTISHCISFDHVYLYLKAAHPATLDSPKRSYSHYSFHKKILYLANQAQNICPPMKIQSVHLDLECFKVVNSSTYASALDKLQVIWKERNQSKLNVSITPGERIMFASEDQESSASTAMRDRSAEQQEEKKQMGLVTQTRDNSPCRILCVECDQTLNYIIDYKQHIKGKQHRKKLIELFGPGQYSGALSQIKLYQHMWNRHGRISSPPLIGLPLLTVFVQRPCLDFHTPLYLCHACELNIPVSSVSVHLTSTQHYFNVFSYTKPDLVFLGSRNLVQFAQEQQAQEKKMTVLQVCELPSQQLTELRTLAYERIMERIGKHSSKLRKCVQVEKRVTLQSYSRSSERKCPLLGLQFMVKYTTTQHYFKSNYLCLLCKKKLPERHAITHVLGFPHMFAYLDMVHPGSLSKEDSEQVSLIMDLAQQAEKIAPNMTLREVDVSFGKFSEIEKNSSFMSAVNVLQVIFRDKGLGELKLSVVPGARLVSSFETHKENNSSKCEKQGHTSSDTEKLNVDGTHTTMPKTEEKLKSKYSDLLHTEHKELLKTPCITSTHIQPAEPSLATAHSGSTSSQPSISSLHKEQSETLKLDQKSLTQEGLPDHNSKEHVQTVKQPQTQDSNVPQQQSGELAQKPVVQVEALQMPAQSPACLKAGTPAVPQTHLSTCTELGCYLKMPNRQPVIGLKSVIECCTVGQQPLYVCVTCAERCEESSIIKHLLSYKHRLQYLESVGYGPKLGKKKVRTKWLQVQADVVEKMQGCGEAETLKLDAKDYHEISSAPIITALGKVRDSLLKLASEISAESPKTACSDVSKSDESHGSGTFKSLKETEEKDSPRAHLKEIVKSTEPETPQQNPNDPAQSSPYLWTYLTSPTRTEPVIGLSMVTEYRNANGLNSFLCSCCKVILATRNYMGHLISPRHRLNYFKSKYPEFVTLLKSELSLTGKISELQKKAQFVQDREGWGCLKVVEKEYKQPQKKTEQPSEDTENDTSVMAKKQEPSQTTGDTEPQDPESSVPKPTEQQNIKKMSKRNVVIDAENSAKAQILESSQAGGDTEPQDHNSHETKPTKQQNNKKIKKLGAVIGLNFITCVHHDKKKLFFCELCSVRGHLDHMSSVAHRKTYVKYKYPDWTASGTDMKKLYKIALRLAAVERSTGMGMRKLNVSAKVFTALRTAPLNEALSQLKSLQTKPEDGMDMKIPSSQPETSTLSNHEHGTVCSAATTNSLQQENHSGPYESPDPLNTTYSHHTPSLISCCPFSVPVSFVSNSSPFSRTVSFPFSSSTELHASPGHSSHISPPPPSLCSTFSSTFPSPSPVHIPYPLSSQHESTTQCLLVPHPLYEPISPPSASDCQDITSVAHPCSYPAPPVYEPISPPAASDSKDLSDDVPPCSSTPPSPVKLPHHTEWEKPGDGPVHHETGPGALTSYAKSKGASGSELIQSAFPCSPMCSHFTCNQSVLKEEDNCLNDTTPSKTYCFPNLPTVVEQSHASMFLSVKGLSNTDPIIGLSNILECRRISQPTFFLCLNCAEKVSRENFCDHMTSERHQHLSIRTQYCEIFQHWPQQMIPQMTIRDLAEKVALTEKGLDAKVIKLNQNQYESLCSADFHDAVEILQRMFGPCLDENSQPSHLASLNQSSNEISTVRSSPESMETEKERDHQLQQSCDNTTQIQEPYSSRVPLKEFDSAQGNPDTNNTACTNMQNWLQQSQSSQKALPKSVAQTSQPQHQSVVHIDLTAESDSRKALLHSPKPISKKTKENPTIETPESAAEGLQERRLSHTFPCTPTFKQEKAGHVHSGVDITHTLEAKNSQEPTGNSIKHTDLKYINKNRTEADAVVGLSAVIECRSEGQASLYLCVSCSSKLNHDVINYHLVKSGHRYSYLKTRYPSLFEDWSDSDSRPVRYMRLMRLANKVEKTNEDEPGQLQVMKLNYDDLKEIKAMPYDKAIIHLQKIRQEQNLCALKTCISPKITKRLIKQEKVETEVTTQYSPQLPGMISQEPRRALKRKVAEQDLPPQSFPGKEQCSDVPSNHMAGDCFIGNNQEPSDSSVKRRKISDNDSDSVPQLQNDASVLTTANPNRSSCYTPAKFPETSRGSPRSLDPSSQIYKKTTSMDETVLKNNENQESSSIIAPQQKDSCHNTSTIHALCSVKGQEIARLSEKRPLVKKGLSENAWNYENRQFSPETPSVANTTPIADSSAATLAMEKQCIAYSLSSYNEVHNPHYNWNIPDKSLDPNLTHNANANFYLSMIAGYGTPNSVTNQVTPENALSYQYPMHKHPDYPSVIPVSNTVAPDYLVPVGERAMNYEAAAPDISTNGTYLTSSNSHTVFQSQPVYQPVRLFQDPETHHSYYAYYSYNQTLHANQMAADNENVTSTPAAEPGVYTLASWPQKKN
ncbi:uncharacterized protein si:ch211-199g17.2 isoform X2 [Neoarius graeffei]|uniref:uncharacterized protein si:ch211-199g17.2 isoform X2 n=1 Tax=Neoarius graeffei TaxID=443677 RepID=UPI00298D4E52|nr:uncharacterized protein si:ch211-199g17.2 isoform X2 [Neoarius graeffei]